MRVLVTGGRGFAAGWLIPHLESVGDSVVTLDTEVDITNAGALADAVRSAGPDAICHLAAQTSVAASWTDPGATYTVNTIGTLHLMEAAAACTPHPRVLLVSSSEVYGVVTAAALPVREDHPFAPVSPYAASKAAAELIAIQAGLGRGLEVIRARPFNHTGPGQRADFVVPALARQVAAAVAAGADRLETGNLDVRRDITDVRDVVRAYRDLLERGVPGQAYNVCRGQSVRIEDVARRLMAIAGVDLRIVIDPARVRAHDLPDLRGDPARIHAATGWSPEIALDATLAAVLDYWQRPAAQTATR